MGNATGRAFLVVLGLCSVLAMVLSACGGGAATATARPQPTAAPPTAVPQATATSAPRPTAAPTTAAPTATPAPTATRVPPTPAAAAPKTGGILNLGSWTTPAATGNYMSSFVNASIRFSATPSHQLYNNLIIADPYNDHKTTGELLASWSITQGGTHVTLKTVQGVKWHDGAPFSAKDVVNTLNNHLNPPDPFRSNYTGVFKPVVKEVKATDDTTVEIDMVRASASFVPLLSLYEVFVLPAHKTLLETISNPVGTGPFKFKSFQQDARTDFERNPTYFLKDPAGRQLPFLDGLTYNQFTDTGLLISAFRIGRVKYIDQFHGPVILPQRETIAKDVPGAVFYPYTQTMYGPVLKNTAPFDDARVREAIDLYMDRRALLDIEYGTNGSIYAAGMLPVELGGIWGLPPKEIMSRPGYRYLDASGKLVDSLEALKAKWGEMKKDPADVARAKELLSQAGIRSGQVKIKVVTQSVVATKPGPVFASQMSELFGATWELEVPPTASDYPVALRQGRYVVAFGNHGSFGLDEPFLTVNRGGWYSGSTDFVGDWPKQAEVDRLYEAQDLEVDAAKRKELIYQLQRAVLDSRIRMIGLTPQGFYTGWPDVKDVPRATSTFDTAWRLHRVWLDSR